MESVHTPRQIRILEILRHKTQLPPATLVFAEQLALTSRDHTPISASSHTCVFESRKTGLTLANRSRSYENARLTLHEHNPNVVACFTELGAVAVDNPQSTGGGRKRHHHPDILVVYRDSIVLEVVKPNRIIKSEFEDAEKKWFWGKNDTGDWTCPPLMLALQHFGKSAGVRVVTEHQVPPLLVRNWEHLRDYVDEPLSNEQRLKCQSITDEFAKNEGSTLAAFLRKSAGKFDADDLHTAIAYGYVYVDLEKVSVEDKAHTKGFSNRRAATIEALADLNTAVQPGFLAVAEPLPLALGSTVLIDGVSSRVDFVGNTRVSVTILTGDQKGNSAEIPIDKARQFRAPPTPAEIHGQLKCKVAELAHLVTEEARAIAYARSKLLGIPVHGAEDDLPVMELDRSKRTHQRWRARAIELEAEEFGSQWAGLIPMFHRRGWRGPHYTRQLADFVIGLLERIHNSNEGQYLSIGERYQRVIEALEERAKTNDPIRGPDNDPCIYISQTLFRKLRRIWGERREIQKTQGLSAANDLLPAAERLEHSTPIHGTFACQRCHIDWHHLKLGLICGVTHTYLDQACIGVLLDAKTRRVLAITVSFRPPGWSAVARLLRICVSRFGVLPRCLVLDNAKEFRCREMRSFCAFAKIDREYRRSRMPKDGGVLERLFGVTEQQIIRDLPGSTWLQALDIFQSSERPAAAHAELSLEAVALMLMKYFYEVYDIAYHPALRMSPAEAWATSMCDDGKRKCKRCTDSALFRVMLLRRPRNAAGVAKVQGHFGVQVNGYRYTNDDLQYNESVAIRWDDSEPGIVYVYGKNKEGESGWTIARCRQIQENDYIAPIYREFANDVAIHTHLNRRLQARATKRALTAFCARFRRMPANLVELAKEIADENVRLILLGLPPDADVKTSGVVVPNAPPPPHIDESRDDGDDSVDVEVVD